ncbi:MAG: sensor histidine kinase, partial [Pseudomonadota bacterium]
MMKFAKRSGNNSRGRWYLRLAVLVISLLAVIVIYVSNQFLTQRFTETISNRSEVRLALYVTNLMNELQRNSVVPQLLSRDPELISALEDNNYSQSTARLLSFV